VILRSAQDDNPVLDVAAWFLEFFWSLELEIWSFYLGCSRSKWLVSASSFVIASGSVAS
jgi:hypothetical protein